jgi:UDP:flavonoid glycosyltransferase YjiC (YdhE family)
MRVAFYAVNGLGLGHVTRLVSIARALRRLHPQVEVLFLTSSEADHVIFREGFAAVKLPSKSLREQVGLQKARYLKLVQTVTWNTLAAFEPDVLVVDTLPAGSFEELVPVLRWRQKNVFVFREQKPEAAGAALLQATLPLYDLVLVPHADARVVGPVPEPEKLTAVGPILIREPGELPTREAARRSLGLPADGTLIYASFGGGGDPDGAAALQVAHQAVAKLPQARLVVGVGPLMRQLPELPGATLLVGRYPALDFLPAFDAAVTAAGYNAVHELLLAQVPAVFVPFERGLDDQARRAHELEAAGAGLTVPLLEPQALARALESLLDPRKAKAQRAAGAKLVPKNGATAAARAIAELAR